MRLGHNILQNSTNDVLLVSKILLGYEEALWPKKLEISHASQILTSKSQILVLSYLANYYCKRKRMKRQNKYFCPWETSF